MVYSILGNEIFEADHVNCIRRSHFSLGPQVVQPWSRYLFVMIKHLLWWFNGN